MIGFKEAVQRCLLRSFVWRGRASRAEYWWFVLFLMLCSVGAAFLATASHSVPIISLLATVLYVGAIFPVVAVSVRRLHDTDRNGAWVLVGMLPLLGLVVLVFFCQQGDPMPNRYGPPPSVDPLVSPAY
ncbi:DUF805 domain-containing protein [Streptomyces sp. B6B3]|uniref:DUF805 domain-containing protein n=1 Tax=Streptomyces sp. B6B3 TaxID=3153570 RepID=UPI00325E2A24